MTTETSKARGVVGGEAVETVEYLLKEARQPVNTEDGCFSPSVAAFADKIEAALTAVRHQGLADEEAAAYEQAHRAGESHGRIMAALKQPMQQHGGGVCIEAHWLENIAAAAALLEASGDTFNAREAAALRKLIASANPDAPPSAPVGVESEPGAVRSLVAAANAVLALYPGDDQLWTLESAVRPFNATKPAECASGCPPQQVCDYCQIAALAQQPAAMDEARPFDDWHEDDGPVVWWKLPVDEPAWIGTPLDSDWPGYHTHWTPHPAAPAAQHQEPTT